MTGNRTPLALCVSLAGALALTGCGEEESTPERIASAARKTSEARTARLAISGLIEGGAQRSRLRYSAEGSFDYARRSGRFHLQPLKPEQGAGVPAADARGELILGRRSAYVRSRALARTFWLDRKRWLRIGIVGRVEHKGIDFRPVAESINGVGALRWLRATSGSVERLGEETIRGVPTTHYRTTVKRPRGRAETLSVPVEVWIDDKGYVKRIAQRFSYGPPKHGIRATQRVEFLDLGVRVDVRRPPAKQAVNPVAATVAKDLRDARRFRGYRLYFVGSSYRGLQLSAVLRIKEPIGAPVRPGGRPEPTYPAFSFIYGDCEPPRDPQTGLAAGGCGPPLEIRNGAACARPPTHYAPPTARLRGVPASLPEEGAILYTGQTAVGLFTTDVEGVVAELRSLDGTVGPGGRLQKPVPGALEGRLRCPK